MTLIITELSSYGISMVADSAITMDIIMPITRVIGHRVYFGATKLRPIPKLEAGISFWGEGQIGDIDTDVWILNFIQRNEENYESLEDFASLLQDELREYVPEIIDPQDLRYGTLGFHLAGYENHNDDMLPTFWHIHNGQSETTP
ncbi:MAG TPA: hypothetical protein ENO13_00165 [Candidatus Bathyarchaeota archaeon]|nr:hypothetical protein [Candidatus Bathyarchaeota archaeon]